MDEEYQVIYLNEGNVQDEEDLDLEKRNINELHLTDDQLKNSLMNGMTRSIVLILPSNEDWTCWKEYSSIDGIYGKDLQCLWIRSEKKSSIEMFIKKRFDRIKDEENGREPSKCFQFWKKFWFLFGLALVLICSYLNPDIAKTGGWIRSEWTIKYGCVIFIFFLSGLGLKTKDLTKEILHLRLHFFIQIFSFLLFPLMMSLFCYLFQRFDIIHRMILIGLILLGSTSTTISSNVVMTKNANGNECAALVNAILGNLIGIYFSPILISFQLSLKIFDHLLDEKTLEFQMNYFHVIWNLSLTVLFPLILGQILHHIFRKKILIYKEKFYFSDLNSLALLALIWSGFSTAFAKKSFDILPKKDLFLLILFNSCLYLLSSVLIFVLARIPIRFWEYSKRDTIAMIFCGATKTLAMGIPLINALFPQESNDQWIALISLPLIIYHVTQLILGSFQVILLKSWINR